MHRRRISSSEIPEALIVLMLRTSSYVHLFPAVRPPESLIAISRDQKLYLIPDSHFLLTSMYHPLRRRLDISNNFRVRSDLSI
jgi:hypothetical protein